MTDRELLSELIDSGKLSDDEQTSFESMFDWIVSRDGRQLSEAQRKWVRAIGLAKGVIAEEAQNLFSSGKVPVGIATKKTDGELKAAEILARRPLAPPGRRTP